MMLRRLIVLAIVAALALSGGCASAKEKMQARYDEGLVAFSPEALAKAEVNVLWQIDLTPDPKDKKTRVEIARIYLYEDTVLIESTMHRLYAFDRATGKYQWIVVLPAAFDAKPTLFKDVFYGVAGGRFVSVDRKGIVTLAQDFPFSIIVPFMMTDDYIYAASTAGGVHKLDRKNLLDVWFAPARGRGVIMGQPILFEDLVIFGTSAGDVNAFDFITGERRFDLKDFVGVFTGIVNDDSAFYFGADDFYLHAYTSLGSPKWRTIVQGRTNATPVLYGDSVFVGTDLTGVWDVAKADGAVIWQCPKAVHFLSAGGGKVYVMGPQDEVWVLDAANGETKTRIDVSQFNFAPVNTFGDGVIYLGDPYGRIYAVSAK